MDRARLHARLLGRATFGPRPGEPEALQASGAEAWLEAELARPADPDGGLARRLAGFPALAWDESAFLEGAELGRSMGRDTAQRKRTLAMLKRKALRTAAQVAGARVVRAVHGPAGLREVMVDFWSNHFSVDARKGFLAGLLPHYQREVLDRHALGRFEDLLLAVARSPAMLVYLDNWTSTRAVGSAGRGRARGLNENYARELLELHTVGIDAGYTQRDVVETARVLTGWSLESRSRPVFRFRPFLHERGAKTVLGERVPGGGQEEGEALLRRLARHPATARHLARKLAQRFVSDAPPPALVARAAERFLETEGDVPAVLRVVLLAPELADPAHRKVKTPLRLYASALRESGGEARGDRETLRVLARLGELPFFARTPAGFPETAEPWIDPGAMLERMRLGLALAGSGTSRALRFATPEFQWA